MNKVPEDLFQSDTIIIKYDEGPMIGRFADKNDGLKIWLGHLNQINPGGGHGVGKITAFNLSSINTVFYLNQYNGESRFIGRFIANTVMTSLQDLIMVPLLFWKKETMQN